MKRSELFFGALLVPIDILALLTAGVATYLLRINPIIQDVRPAVFELDLEFYEYVYLVAAVSLFIVVVFALQGLYTIQVTRKWWDEFTRIFAGISIGVMAVIMFIFLRAELFQSRFLVIVAYVLSIVFVAVGRYAVRRIQQMFLKRGVGVHRVALVGNGRMADSLSDLFQRRYRLGYKVVGILNTVNIEELERIRSLYGVDEVIQTDPDLSDADTLALLDFCEDYKIDYQYVPNMFETYAVNVEYAQMGTIPLLRLSRTPLDGWGRIAKRVIDLIGSIVGLVLFAPLFFVTALAIKVDSAGPVFYRQVRVGRNKKPFEIMKFRSMHTKYCVGSRYGGVFAQKAYRDLKVRNNERSGPLFKMKEDPRITRVGAFIRRWRIDELPQLINVFKGEMSLIGPRPHLPEEIAQYEKHHRKLFTIKPGMSGMAQVEGNAGLPFEQEAKLDISYIEHWSLWLDCILLLKTIKILFLDKNAV